MYGHRYRAIVPWVFVLLAVSGCGYLLTRQIAEGPTLVDGKVLFRYYAPNARRVQLGGDWQGNNWTRGDGSVGEANVGLMEDDDNDGVWEIRVALPAGRYRYLFLIDENTWHTDPGNVEEVDGGPVERCSQIVLHSETGRLEIR
jgi:1,4-alpha-glucan branching enzyme